MKLLPKILLLCLAAALWLTGCRREAPVPSPTAAPQTTEIAWIEHQVELYGLTMRIPEGWTVIEENRRPAPAGSEALHDCADYIVKNFAGTVRLSIKPQCSRLETALEPSAEDAVVVMEKAPQEFIIRYYDDGRSLYAYTNASLAPTGSESGPPQANLQANPPVISIGSGQDMIIMQVDLQINSLTLDTEAALSLADQIVASLDVIGTGSQ